MQAKPDLPKAFEHYKNALTINPKHLGGHGYIGEAYLMGRKPLDAQRHLSDVKKICGNRSCEAYADLCKKKSAYKLANS